MSSANFKASTTSPETRTEGEPVRGARSHLLVMAWTLLRAASYLAVFAVIVWALVRHGERSPTAVDAASGSRFGHPVGFEGDPDFYGLGIRLGVYFQWLTDIITTGYLGEERRNVLITYHIFSISITVALFVKIFASACIFSAEIFVVLVLFWGGYNIVQIPMMKVMEQTEKDRLLEKVDRHERMLIPPRLLIPSRKLISSRRLIYIMRLLNFMMSPIMVWFWARVAAAEGVDFASTPGGTAYFFFARIHGAALKPFNMFMATASAIIFLWIVYVLIRKPTFSDIEGADVSPYLGIIACALCVLSWIPSFIFSILGFYLTALFVYCHTVFTRFLRKVYRLFVVDRGAAVSRVPTLESGEDGMSDFDRKLSKLRSKIRK